jgi:hypothetical protein
VSEACSYNSSPVSRSGWRLGALLKEAHS